MSKEQRERRVVEEIPTMIEMALAYLDQRMMRQALNELDPFVKCIPLYMWSENDRLYGGRTIGSIE